MSTIYDDKGKIFTDVVKKDAVKANIQTTVHRIEGLLHISAGKRVKDELDEKERFLAVTDALVFDQNGKTLFNAEFMTIARDQVVWIIPGAASGE